VSQDVEIQLQVWKDLAISKQILMGAAADALGLDSECSTAELKAALDQAIQRARNADIKIQEIRSQADSQVDEYRKRAEAAEKARIEADETAATAEKLREQAERQLSSGKADNAEALRKAKADVTDKQNKLKAISKSLADTPENVVRKLKTLKKQKMDEARLRGQAETRLQSMRKEKNGLEATLETRKANLESASKLLQQAKSLHETCQQAADRIKKLSDKKKDQLKIPDFDLVAIEELEKILADK
jgi:colicin import membrane protein